MKMQSKDTVQVIKELYDSAISDYMSNFTTPREAGNDVEGTHVAAHLAAARRMISTKLKKYFEDEYEKSKGDLTKTIDKLNPTVTIRTGSKMVLMHEDDQFQVFYTVRNGARKLDDKKLRMLLVKAGVEPDVVQKAFEDAMSEGNPQTLIDIIPVGET